MQSRHFIAATLGAVALTFGAPTQPAYAHHCFKDVFDANAPIAITGKIIAVEWVNPHALIHVSGAEPGQAAKDWVFWAATRNALLRLKLNRAALDAGTEVTIRGYKAKDTSCAVSPATNAPACKADGRELTLSDGRAFHIASGGDGGPDGATCMWKNSATSPN